MKIPFPPLRPVAFVLAALAPLALAAAERPATQWNANEAGVVLDGYDVVAYFTEDRPVRGRAELSAVHDGGTFYFASPAHLEAFAKEPTKYAPKFGGYCAFGVAVNKAKVPTDPRTFKIYNGELLLFFNDLHEGAPINTKIFWNQNEEKLHAEAVATWPTLD